MPAMRAAHSRNVRRVPRCREPVMDRRADAPTLNGRLTGAMVPSDQQNHAIAAPDRLFETAIDRCPRPVEVHAVQVEHPVRLQIAAANALVP